MSGGVTGVPAPTGCDRDDCAGLPAHDHVRVPFPEAPFAATVEGRDVDRVHVDWRAVAYELWTGRRLVPEGQLALDLEAHSG